MKRPPFVLGIALSVVVPLSVEADTMVRILTNHIGYEASGPKHAVILGSATDRVSACAIKDAATGEDIFSVVPVEVGAVARWRDWRFWTLDFDAVTREASYVLECSTSRATVRSFPFSIQKNVLEGSTVSNLVYYFKGQRSSGSLDKADRAVAFQGADRGVRDLHGGWFDATGDYGKHFSHLSFSTYFNPQQIPFTVFSLFKAYEALGERKDPAFRQYLRRLLDEATYGADYLVRARDPEGSFYQSVSAPGPEKRPEDRRIGADMKAFQIKAKTSDPSFKALADAAAEGTYEVGYRSGGGLAIAALALAGTRAEGGEFSGRDYLAAAEGAFSFLEKNNLRFTNDGRENILDDYCALTAATELFRATHRAAYKEAADRRARSLVGRLRSGGPAGNYWRADDADRPFFHPSDAGFPVVSLSYYLEVADPGARPILLDAVRKAMAFELDVTAEVANPFGYARQLVQDTTGARRTSFFFPHHTETAPWWQGENARLSSLATAARLTARALADDSAFRGRLESYAANQLNWILGLNPFDASMLHGSGRNNPPYRFFDSYEYTNAPGGICNGITSGFVDEDGIDFNLPVAVTGADNDWRWGEQWLPHASWFLMAVAARR